MAPKRSVLLLLMWLATSLFADFLLAGPAATLTGRVTDTSGSVIDGVKVEATNVETSVTFPGQTNAAGLYNIPNLPPGIYRVIVQKFAFRTVVKPDVELHVQDVVALNFAMELGSVTQSVTVEAGAPLIQANAQRGGAFTSRQVSNLPLVSLSPLSLARVLPGVIEPAGSLLYSILPVDEAIGVVFSANGTRTRANNYLLDGAENNDIAYTGVAQPFNIADAVDEVSVQTGNFSVDFGRTGGGVFNLVTKSGTNSLNGTLLWRYQSELFNSVSNFDKLNGTPRTVFNRNVYGFTLGGPVRQSKTFFFGAFQQDSFRSRHFTLVVPTEPAVATLRSLFPSNPRLEMYLNLLGPLRGSANPIPVPLGEDPITGVDRGVVQFASAPLGLREINSGPQGMVRIDHNRSEQHRLTFRYIFDSRKDSPKEASFPGFYQEAAARNHNLLFTDQHSLSPTWTNEFRFSYANQDADQNRISPDSIPSALTQPLINMVNVGIAAPGMSGIALQSRQVNNLLFQETLTTLRGRHTFRYGVEFLRQLATQTKTGRFVGELAYSDAPTAGYSAFANFLDDFSGLGVSAQKDFLGLQPDLEIGSRFFHPNSFRQTYFLQDVWLPAPSLSVTLGLRYENFGQPANALRFPAFAGFDPENFFKPNRVNADNNNIGPAFGLAWSPSFHSGWLHKMFGENKTVWRGGYQISYDAFFTSALSLLLASSTPNGISWVLPAPNTGRGRPNWSEQLPVNAPIPSLTDNQRGVLEKDFRNPYTERWSFGFQRQLSNSLLLDGSYVGSESHKLTAWEQVNPLQPDGERLHPGFGPRQIRASHGNSSYHAMQWRVDRRFARGFQLTSSYTWSRNIDSTSEGVSTLTNQSPLIEQADMKRERGPSDYDRTHRFTILYIWSVPGPRTRFLKDLLGGWSIAGITTFQSGAPFTLVSARSGVRNANALNRPDIANPNAPLNTRAILSQDCAAGWYLDPDTDVCVTPSYVHWIQGSGPFNAATVGRNTLRAGGINNFDLSLSKSFQIAEQKRLEFRWEALNALNHPQYTQVPARDVNSLTPGRFLNRDFTDSGIRSMWVQLKLLF